MKYDDFISNILNTRGRFACGEEYHERHHIVPRCLGGTDDKENLIDLYAREHFEAHRLLALENPENNGLIYAWHRMSCQGTEQMERYQLTGEEYEELKKAFSQMRRQESTGVKQSPETIEKRVSKLRGRKMPEHVKKIIQECHTGKTVSAETREKLSKALKGRESPLKGVKQTEQQRLSHCKYIYYCPELDEYFSSTGEIRRKYNAYNVSNCILGKRQTSGKHPITGEKLHWIRKEV